jgi:hypothetical protein
MKGKNRCRILKDIRRRIAEENGIEYVTSECKYKGDCLGTCPKCESEVRYLERELEKRRSLGYKVTVAGLAAGITLASTGCSMLGIGENTTLMGEQLTGDMPNYGAESSLEECSVTAGILPPDDSSNDFSDDSSSESSMPDPMGQVEVSDDEIANIGEIPDDEIESMLAGDIPVSDYE